jgi:hypothetical protein
MEGEAKKKTRPPSSPRAEAKEDAG